MIPETRLRVYPSKLHEKSECWLFTIFWSASSSGSHFYIFVFMRFNNFLNIALFYAFWSNFMIFLILRFFLAFQTFLPLLALIVWNVSNFCLYIVKLQFDETKNWPVKIIGNSLKIWKLTILSSLDPSKLNKKSTLQKVEKWVKIEIWFLP